MTDSSQRAVDPSYWRHHTFSELLLLLTLLQLFPQPVLHVGGARIRIVLCIRAEQFAVDAFWRKIWFWKIDSKFKPSTRGMIGPLVIVVAAELVVMCTAWPVAAAALVIATVMLMRFLFVLFFYLVFLSYIFWLKTFVAWRFPLNLTLAASSPNDRARFIRSES